MVHTNYEFYIQLTLYVQYQKNTKKNNKNKDSGRERKEEIKINAGLWLWMYWILRIIGEDSISGSLKNYVTNLS